MRKILASFFCAFLLVMQLAVQASEDLPDDLKGVGFTEKIGQSLPLNLTFTNQQGKKVALKDLFSDKPVIVQMVYHSCPMLCDMLLNAYIDGARDMKNKLGKDYKVITLSIDPSEELDVTQNKRKAYLDTLGNLSEAQKDGWIFLQGDSLSISKFTEATGFKYKLLPDGEYSHQAGLVIVNPDGKIKQYLYGLHYSAFTLDQSLLSGKAKQNLTMQDKVMMFCYRYNPQKAEYVLFAENFMKLGGVLVVLVVGFFLVLLWSKEKRRPSQTSLSHPTQA